MRIIFMGTPEFAVESLRKLVENKYNVVAVVTMPDKPFGRHHETLMASPVKEYALSVGIPVLQPEKLKDPVFLEELRSYQADLQIVVAFRMLPEVVWNMPRMGTFNLHAALLPQYRGAAPINWAVINGETETGVTTFFLDHDIDTGRIIHRVATPIADTDTVGDVYDRLMYLGADLVLQTVDDISEGRVQAVEQSTMVVDGKEELRPAPKLFKENTEIRWSQHSMKSAYDFIRGLSPYPGAWTTLRTADGRETVMKIYFSEKLPTAEAGTEAAETGTEATRTGTAAVDTGTAAAEAGTTAAEAGTEAATTASDNVSKTIPLLSDGRTYLQVALPGGFLRVTDLQLAGKRRMKVADFLRGAHLESATFVEN